MTENRVFAPSAVVYWPGEMGPDFRAQAEKILDPRGNPARPLSEPAWLGLWNVVFGFAGLLAHDSIAGPADAQQKLIAKAAEQGKALLAMLDELETYEMGRAVSNILDDAWSAEFDQEGLYVRNLETAQAELASLVGTEQADELIEVWEARGFLQRPWPAMDFKNDLHVFAQAAARLAAGGVPLNRDPLDDLIAMLCAWVDKHGIEAGASKAGGKLPNLVLAILAQVPAEPASLRSRRFFHIDPASIASRVLNIRSQYRARTNREKPDAA